MLIIKLSCDYITMKKMSIGKSIRVSVRTYNELAKLGTLSDSFDSVISNILKQTEQLKSIIVNDSEEIVGQE